VELKSPSILFLVTEDWYFCLHRLPIARAAHAAGWTVLVATQVKDHGQLIEREGFQLIPMKWTRRSMNPVRGLAEVRQIVGIYRKYQPDLVHHVALKPSLYGSMAGLLCGRAAVVNNLAGLGQAFTSQGLMASVVRTGLTNAFRLLFRRRGSCTIVENADDWRFLVTKVGLERNTVALIRGIGVDVKRYRPGPEDTGETPTITMVSRMLWPKGVGELVEATRILRRRGQRLRVQLVGVPDASSRVSVPQEQLLKWQSEGVVEWLGYREDVPELWRRSHIAVLPSYYREGIPRSLLEAAACARPIVTTDMPGCREIVRNGHNGILVAPRDPQAIADAIERLLNDAKLRQCMGEAGRALVEQEFTEEHVVAQTMSVYRKLLDERKQSS